MTAARPPGDDDTSSATTADEAQLTADFGACFYLWRSDRWRASPKTVLLFGHVEDTVGELRVQLDAALARAVPELRAQLGAAEAAAERLHRQHSGQREAGQSR